MKWLIAIVVVIIGAVLLFVYNRDQTTTATPSPSPTEMATASPEATPTATPETITVTYTDSGYSPATVTISAGQAVTFVNNSSRQMWIASAGHPTHTAYSGTTLSEHCPDAANTSFDACQGVAKGQSWSFTFTKTGTWKYHNHLRTSDFGTIVVN